MFKTGPGHTREHLAQILDQRQDPLAPIQMPDALARNTPGAHPTQTASCIPHGTRKFVDLHRKNALFYHTVNSAKVGDLFMTPIHFGTRDPTTPR